MADKKLEKALYGPSTTEVALGAFLGLLAGLLVACAYLVFKPVAQVKEMPPKDKQVRGMVYYLPGSDSSTRSRNWQAKLKQFTGGASVVLNEDELNAWSASVFGATPAPAAAKPGAKPDEKKPADAKPANEGIFIPGQPNFKIVNGKIQIGFKCTLNWYGLMQDVTFITTGGFKRSGDVFVFAPDSVYLGSCPLQLLPVVSGQLLGHLEGKRKASDDIITAWAKLGDVSIEGATLKLTVQ